MATSSERQGMSAEGAEPPETTTTGGQKPLHRFLRGEPKCVGIVMLFLGLSMFLFGIPLRNDKMGTSAELFSSFWLGILYTICGSLYVQAERKPTKKIVTICFALSIIAILGTLVAAIDFIKSIVYTSYGIPFDYYSMEETQNNDNDTTLIASAKERYMQRHNLEAVFLSHSLVAGVILITMTTLARLALHSSRTQMVVVMRNLPAAE